MTDKSIEFDFGKDFLFSLKTIVVTEEDIKDLKSGNLKEPKDKYRGCDVKVFTDGKYPRVLRLSKDIPVFDSGDREYDSWYDLYLVQEKNGNIYAVYCTGGYRIAKIKGYAKVYKYPEDLRQYFIET
ncbi:MAG: hypothetical protein Q4C58_06855 [Eubacteriales bacterium]|nr:hypothetical protein [Eubacteriales bacterium]